MMISSLHELVGDEEDVSRFLTQSNHFDRTLDLVSQRAFTPSKDSNETSVFRRGKEFIADLKPLGLAVAGERKLHGVAFIQAQNIRSTELDVFSDEPPCFHAVIRNWPNDTDVDIRKAKQKSLAQQLASKAELILFDDSENI